MPDCSQDGLVCSGTQTPLCRTADGDPLENVCVCDSDSCPTGQGCDPSTGLCNVGGTPVACTAGQVGGSGCAQNEVCIEGNMCQALCDDLMSCIGLGAICDPVSTSPTFNQCGDPDDVAVCSSGCFAQCDDKAGHDREDGGPIIYDLVISGDMGSSANCPAPARVDRFVASVFSASPLPDNVFTEGLRRLSSGDEADTFSEGPGTSSHPTIERRGNNLYQVTFFLCDDPSAQTIFSVFVRDTTGRDSNAICFAPVMMGQ